MAYPLSPTTPLAQLQVKNRILLPVKERRIDAGRPCFIVTYQGEEYPANMFEFQQSEANPADIVCLVKSFHPNGRPIFAQDYTPLLKRFYEDGKEYEFTVTSDSSHLPEGQAYYGIRDTHGFYFALYNFDRTRLSVRQVVRCVVRFHGLRLVASLVQDRNTRMARILDEGVVARKLRSEATDSLWDLEGLVALVFSKEGREDFGGRMVRWLRHALAAFAGKEHKEVYDLLCELERCCLYLVENSDFFRDCAPADRQMYLMRLSAITEVVESFRKGQSLICNNKHMLFIDTLLEKLDTAGYLYHAEDQLRMLSSLFALQPTLIPHNMSKLFAILRKGNTANWYIEPIRTAFLSLLEIYINNYRDRIDTLTVPDEEHPDGKISKVVQALAMQMLLSRPEDSERDRHIFDRDLNQALFYRALSYKPLVNTEILLEKSYQSLLGVFRETASVYTWREVHEMAQLATRAASQMPNTSDTEQQLNQMVTRFFDGSNTRLELTMQSIDLYPQRRGNACAPVLPKDLLKWHQPQVHANKHVNHNGLRGEDLMTYRQMWSDIATAMNQVQLVAADKPTKNVKVPPQPGDIVTIRIVADLKGEGKAHQFAAEIVDDRFVGTGVIPMANIVDYNAHATLDCFSAPNTRNPLLFEARVEAYDEASERYTFAMRSLIFTYLNEKVLNYDDEYHCFVTANPPQGLVVISEEGYSFSVPYTSGMPYCAPGDQIVVRLSAKNPYANSTAYFVEMPEKKELGVTASFHALMDEFAVGEYEPEASASDNEEADDQATDFPLSISYVQELTQLLDRVAVLRGDYVQAYNYLALARTLAQVIDDAEREAYYNERMRLLELLKRFAIDGTVNTQELEAFAQTSESLVSSYPELKKQFLRLQAVSFMGKRERNADLWATLGSDTKDTLLHDLARLVLTYNLLDAAAMEREKLAVHDRIYDALRIDARKSDLKYFGDESQTLEFKSTIVCPPDNNMRPDLARQTHNIMRAIAGMLNAEGGTLLLGVNDRGMAEGLQTDLAYPQFANNRDQYRVYIDNNINRHLGAAAGRCVRMTWQMPNGRSILMISIEPCPTLVELDGTVYERRGTSTRPLTGSDLRAFRQKRSQHVEQLAAVGNTALADQLAKLQSVLEEAEPAAPELPTSEATPTASKTATSPATPSLRNTATIATSQLRNNDIYDLGADDFEEPIVVLNFYDADHSHKLTEGYADDQASLSLAIRESDREHHLLLCYANDHCVRVPIKDLLDRKLNTAYKHYAEAPLKYASVIHTSDSFMSIRRDDKGRLFLRIDPADSVPVSAIRYATTPYLDLRGYEFSTCEVLPAKLAPHFATYRRLVASSLGVLISNKRNVVSEFAAHGITVEV